MCGKLYIVPTPVGNLEDITLRALKVLGAVDLILAEDTRTSSVLLKKYAITTRMESHHKFNEHQRAQAVASRIEEGLTVALISDAGTPGISDPGFFLVRHCVSRGIDVECLPGATAFVPALINSALPANQFYFEGFLPVKKGRQTRLEALSRHTCTVILYESPHRLLKTLTQLAQYAGNEREAAVCREISKVHEDTQRGTLEELITWFTAHPAKGEIVILMKGRGKENEDPEQQEAQDESLGED